MRFVCKSVISMSVSALHNSFILLIFEQVGQYTVRTVACCTCCPSCVDCVNVICYQPLGFPQGAFVSSHSPEKCSLCKLIFA